MDRGIREGERQGLDAECILNVRIPLVRTLVVLAISTSGEGHRRILSLQSTNCFHGYLLALQHREVRDSLIRGIFLRGGLLWFLVCLRARLYCETYA
jgi:hypothetical protein